MQLVYSVNTILNRIWDQAWAVNTDKPTRK